VSLLLRRSIAFALDIAILFAILYPAGAFAQARLGFTPDTPRLVWYTLLINFSLPVWTYFIFSDTVRGGQTIGKRILGIRSSMVDDKPIPFAVALLRTAIKLTPWELTHVGLFAIGTELGQFSPLQNGFLALANLMWMIYLIIAAKNGGATSVHDRLVMTKVAELETGGEIEI
jgi:uncharacterized RDD family membrane protein YckC